MNTQFQKILSCVVGAIAVLGTPSAFADGPAYRGSYKDIGPPPFSWTGFYIGVHAGAGWSDADVNIPLYTTPNHSQNGNGFVGGGHVGYNYQIGTVVLGVEGDFSGSTVSSLALSHGSGGEQYQIDENWRASVRARLGFAFGKGLIYATGGVAWVDFDTRYQPANGGTRGTTATGWTAGGGYEYALTSALLLRAEYLFADFDKEHFVHLGPSNVDYQTQEVRGGLTVKF